MRQDKKKDESASGIAAAGRLVKSEKESTEKDPIARIQKYAQEERARQMKEEEEKKKRKSGNSIVQQPKGLLTRLYESVMGSSEKK